MCTSSTCFHVWWISLRFAWNFCMPHQILFSQWMQMFGCGIEQHVMATEFLCQLTYHVVTMVIHQTCLMGYTEAIWYFTVYVNNQYYMHTCMHTNTHTHAHTHTHTHKHTLNISNSKILLVRKWLTQYNKSNIILGFLGVQTEHDKLYWWSHVTQ